MLELTKAADLLKASKLFGSYFGKASARLEKSYSFHKGMAAQHASMSTHHAGQAVIAKAAHDALGDEHEMKACMGKTAAFHTDAAACHDGMSKAHAAHAELMKAEVDEIKSMSAEFAGATAPVQKCSHEIELSKACAECKREEVAPVSPLAESMNEMVIEFVNKSKSVFDSDPEVIALAKSLYMDQIRASFGGVTLPTNASAINRNPGGDPTNKANVTAIPRPGSPEADLKKIPLSLHQLV